MSGFTRRSFLSYSTALAGAAAMSSMAPAIAKPLWHAPKLPRFGLVTYLWGKDMDLETVIRSCTESGLLGVELRTEHKHAVEPALTRTERTEVRKKFEDSPVELVGYGSNAQFHENDPDKLRANIELTKQYIQLMHDCGGSGVKVKPNSFVNGVPHEQTIEQIGKALNEVAEYGQQYGQQIRVEVHGTGTSELPVMKAIFDVADHPNAAICWNSNGEDLKGEGLAYNFGLVSQRFGATAHVRELTENDYPYAELFKLLGSVQYSGWVLLEARTEPANKVEAMKQQLAAFHELVKQGYPGA